MDIPRISNSVKMLASLLLCLCCVSLCGSELSEQEAEQIVAHEMANKAEKESRRRADLESMAMMNRRVIQKGGQRILINRVVPPVLKPRPLQKLDISESPRMTEAEWRAMIASQPEHQSISLSVTVFDVDYSKILWRNRSENGKSYEEYEIWSNLGLNYLRLISTFERDDVVFDCFSYVNQITRENEKAAREFARKYGHEYKSRWERPPVKFIDEPEYVVIGDVEKIPEALYEQMDAVFAYYLEEEARLRVDFQRSEALQEAREKYLLENPPAPKEFIINHWPALKGGAQ